MERLGSVVSADEGFSLLTGYMDDLTDGLVEELRARAGALRASGDTPGADEYDAWAAEARSIITKKMIMSTRPESPDDAMRIIRSFKGRFDEGFISFCVKMVTLGIESTAEAMAGATQDRPDAATSALDEAESAMAEANFLSIVSTITGVPDHRAKALQARGTLLLYRSRLMGMLGRHEDEKELLAQSRDDFHAALNVEGSAAGVRARSEANLAAIVENEDTKEAGEHLRRAQKLAEEAGDGLMLRTIRRDRARRMASDPKASYALHMQNLDLFEKGLWNARSPITASRLVSEAMPDFEAAVEACMKLGETDAGHYVKALEAAERSKARMLLRLMANIACALGQVPPRLTGRRDEILRRMRQVAGMTAMLPPEQAEMQRPKLERLLDALATAEDQIMRYARAVAIDARCAPCTYGEMKKLVPDNGAILSYFSLPDRLLLFVLDERGLVCDPIRIPMSRQDIFRAALNVSLFIEMRGNLGYDEVQKLFDEHFTAHNLHYFYHMLIEPAMGRISDKKLVYIVPHGHLLGLPFHAMLQPDGSPLVDRFAIAYAPGLSVLKMCRDKGKDARDSCYSAGVSAGKGGPELAAEVAKAVAGIFGCSPMPATREAILGRAGEYDVINIACHSDLDNPYTSFKGLALEDGMLSQNDVKGMDCKSSLVMLTSCDTAHSDVLTGPGQEMGGLIGAFMCAGCPSVLASLYPVPARIVLPMTEAFCQALKTKGVSRAEALRIAQRKMEKERPADNPYYWASFSLWGDA